MNIIFGLMLSLGIIGISNCQSAIRAKPENLKRVDNEQKYALRSEQGLLNLTDLYENHAGLVLIFWQSSCACVKRYQERVNELFKRYSPQGIAFMYVSSNTNESFAHAQAEYGKRKTSVPLVRDEGGRLARALGVSGTPVAVLIDQLGHVRFIGWIDDERLPGERGRRAYLDDALKQYVAGEPILVPTSPMFGCPIR